MSLRLAAALAATCLATAHALEATLEPVADEVRWAPRGVGDLNAVSPAGLRGNSRAPRISLNRGEGAYSAEASFDADAAAAWAEAHRPAAEMRHMPRAQGYVANVLGAGSEAAERDKRFSASELEDLKSKAQSGNQVFQGTVAMPSNRWRD
ncbi:unnamed protein product [Prorocentrum cordatum]|uniref:Uncharacterized protein n=1 Tax=Prorocentrum cordatum TaxID=2364126 RepID=A0ABN9RH33_9DINO|nr:unnamed protein product [Polarella glacialis]